MTTLQTDKDVIRLGSFSYERELGLLTDGDGNQFFFRAQTNAVLDLLCQFPGQLVTRDEIISAVWPDLNVTDDSLTQCIADIRRAVGDRKRTIVKTVPKRGYIVTATRLKPSPDAPVQNAQIAFGEAAASLSQLQSATICTSAKTASQQAVYEAMKQAPDTIQTTRDSNQLTTTVNGLPNSVHLALKIATVNSVGVAVTLAESSSKLACRLAQKAGVGQVLTTIDIRDATQMDAEVEFEELGELILDESEHPRRIFCARTRSGPPNAKSAFMRGDVLPTIAVVPLRGVDTANSERLIGEFLASEITFLLSRSSQAHVISHLSCAAFQNGQIELGDIAQKLNANFLVSGTFRTVGTRIVVDYELAATESHRILWSGRFECDPKNIFNGFSELSDVVGHISKAIVLNEIKKVQVQGPESLRNYSVLSGAVGLMHRLSPQEFERSKILLEALIARVPHQPAPLAWVARWYVLKVMQGWSQDPMRDAETALQSASRALDLDPDNVLALTSTGFVLTNLLGRMGEAEDIYTRALELNPNDSHGRSLKGMLYAFQDRGEEGIRETEHALHLSPLDPHRFFFLALAAGASLSAGDYTRTLELAKESLRINRTHSSTLRMLAATHAIVGDLHSAQQAAKDLMTLQPNLRVSDWLKNSPSADFQVGHRIADGLRLAGIPD